MRKKLYFPIILFLLITLPTSSLAWKGRVVGVSDGDTITVLHNGRGERIRLFGVDCPEKRQAFGKRAKHFTSGLVYGETVEITPMARDRYGRTVALVRVNGTLLNQRLVENGLAWVYGRYCHESFCSRWTKLQQEARAMRKGLWSDPYALPPWEYRHSRQTHKKEQLIAFTRKTRARSSFHAVLTAPFKGNVKTHVFHRLGCPHYNCANCLAEFQTREEALAAGYTPCRICSP